MQTELVFGSGVLAGAGAVVLAVLGRYVRTAHRQHHNRPVVSVSWLSRIRRRRSQRVVMFSRSDQTAFARARDLAGMPTDGPAQRPRSLRPERRTAERPAAPRAGWSEAERAWMAGKPGALAPQPGWSDAGSWVDRGAPQEAIVTLLHGDTHRPERRGGVIRFRPRTGERAGG